MLKRAALLAVLLAAGLYVSEQLLSGLFDSMGVAVTESTWALWLAWAVLALAAAWLIGRWRGLEGRLLAITSVAAALGALVAFAITGFVILLGLVPVSDRLGQTAFVILYLVVAVEAVAVSWLFSGVSLRYATRRAGSAN